MATKRKRGKLKGAAKAAFLRRMAAGRKRTGGAVRRKTSTVSANVPAKRRKSHKRRRAAKNPPFARARARARSSGVSVRGIVGQVVQGAQDAVAITAGQAFTNVISRMVPVTATAPALAVRVAAAIAGGIAAQMALGPSVGRMVLAGGLTVPIRSLAMAAKVPLLTGALSSDEEISRYLRGTAGSPGMGAYPQALGAYPQARRRALGAYPQMGDGQGQQGLATGLMTGGNSYF